VDAHGVVLERRVRGRRRLAAVPGEGGAVAGAVVLAAADLAGAARMGAEGAHGHEAAGVAQDEDLRRAALDVLGGATGGVARGRAGADGAGRAGGRRGHVAGRAGHVAGAASAAAATATAAATAATTTAAATAAGAAVLAVAGAVAAGAVAAGTVAGVVERAFADALADAGVTRRQAREHQARAGGRDKIAPRRSSIALHVCVCSKSHERGQRREMPRRLGSPRCPRQVAVRTLPGQASYVTMIVMKPAVRRDLAVCEVRDEVVGYDFKTHQARCLNRAAAEVFRRCDGTRTPAKI